MPSRGAFLKLIVRANARYDKVPLLLEVREEIEALKVVLRLGQDVKAFSNFGAFEQAIGQVVEIAKENEGWLKGQRQGEWPEPAGDARVASRAGRAMITRSLSRLREEATPPEPRPGRGCL